MGRRQGKENCRGLRRMGQNGEMWFRAAESIPYVVFCRGGEGKIKPLRKKLCGAAGVDQGR
jgi:hypothetical protein